MPEGPEVISAAARMAAGVRSDGEIPGMCLKDTMRSVMLPPVRDMFADGRFSMRTRRCHVRGTAPPPGMDEGMLRLAH